MTKYDTNWRVAAVVATLFAVETFLFIDWIPDDAFICFRYARNLADGLGPVFNLGERVEGASNPLWTALLGLLTAAGLDTVKTAVTLSLVSSLLSVLLAFRLFDLVLAAADSDGHRSAGLGRFLCHKTALAVGLIASLPMVFYATSGLETHAELVFLLLGAILHLEARTGNDPRQYFASQCSFLAVALIRPEGVLFLILGAAFVVFGRLRGTGDGRRAAWVAVIVPLVIYIIFFSLKASYYGSVVPNTYLAKPGAGAGYLKPLWRGWTYITRFFVVSGLVSTLPFCAIAFADKRRRYTCVFLGSLVVAQLAFVVFVGGDVLRFDRFTVPFTPLLLAVALIGFVRLATTKPIRLRGFSMAAALVCAALMVGLNGGRVQRVLNKVCYHDWMHAQVQRRIGAYLREALPPDASIVVNEVGAIAYETGMITHDMIGLTDATVGRILYESYHRYGVSGSEWSVPRIADYLLSKQPNCVIIPSYSRIEPDVHEAVGRRMHPIWEGVFTHPDMARHYRCGLSIRIHDRKYWYVYFRDGFQAAGAPGDARCMEVHEYPERR